MKPRASKASNSRIAAGCRGLEGLPSATTYPETHPWSYCYRGLTIPQPRQPSRASASCRRCWRVRFRERLGVTLGIKRVEVVYERLGPLGSVRQRLGDNSTISLSGGDGSDFSGWWRVECQPVVKRGQCRSPEGCAKRRLDGRSYCGKHHRLDGVKPQPSGRVMVLWAAINHKGAPRLDLLGG